MYIILFTLVSVVANLLTFAFLGQKWKWWVLPLFLRNFPAWISGRKEKNDDGDATGTSLTPYERGRLTRERNQNKMKIMSEGMDLLKKVYDYFLDTDDDDDLDPKTVLSFITKAFGKASKGLREELDIPDIPRRSPRLNYQPPKEILDEPKPPAEIKKRKHDVVETAPVLPPLPRPPPPPPRPEPPIPPIDTEATASDFQLIQNRLAGLFGGRRIPPKSDGAPQGAYIRGPDGKFIPIKK